jgi:hypothetical protein
VVKTTKIIKHSQVAEMVDAHRQVILIEGTAAVEATITENTGSNPVLTTKCCSIEKGMLRQSVINCL